MKYANRMSEIINAFSPEPLGPDQMKEFYCRNTMEYRMGDKYSSPMEDIFDSCQESEGHQAFLLLGHRGCGKSTELNHMSRRLEERGYRVKTITCSIDLDLFNIVYSDLFILMGEALLETAKELDCRMDMDIIREIENFWEEGTKIVTLQETREADLEAGAAVGTPGLLQNVLSIFTKIKADLKYNEETRREYRKKISNRSSEWIKMLGMISEQITKKAGGKHPIVIFEDLDKLNPNDAWNVFYQYAVLLSSMPFPVIYTFPVGLSYDPRFSAMESYFITKTLPMIKIETIDNEPYEDGIRVIREIIKMRAKMELFEAGVLDSLIQYTGGALRDLFHVINSAAKRAERRQAETVSAEDGERALEELKTSLTRRIEKKDYEFLLNICRGNKEIIEDKELLLKMLQASVVLEYNGKRWHNVHPLVTKFLKEQRQMEDE